MNNGVHTVWGVRWPLPSVFDISTILFIFIIIIILLLLIKYNQSLKTRLLHSQQLFLFRCKQLELSNFQVKILNYIISIQKIKEPIDIFHLPASYEQSIATFMHFISSKNNSTESYEKICEDIIVTYEKVYKKSRFRKELSSLALLETEHLICFKTDNNIFFIGKITVVDSSSLSIDLFTLSRQLKLLKNNSPISCILWRTGDAEYRFHSIISNVSDSMVKISTPESFDRSRVASPPFVDVIIPCKIDIKKINSASNVDNLNGIINQLNEEELILKTKSVLSFKDRFVIKFTIDDFLVEIKSSLLADKTTSNENFNFYTFKLLEMSDASKAFVSSTIRDRIFNKSKD